MENIFINEPGLKEFSVILMQEKFFKENRLHFRLCIRNYKDIRKLSNMVSNTRLFSISQFYKTRSDYHSFKLIHILKNRVIYKKLYKFKKKSRYVMSNYIHNTNRFISYLSSKVMTNGKQKLITPLLNSKKMFSIYDMSSSFDKFSETSLYIYKNLLNTDISMLPIDQPSEKFFTSSFSDLSDSIQELEENPLRSKILDQFFISDSLFEIIGDDRCHIVESFKNSLKENFCKNNMKKIIDDNGNKQTNRDNTILFKNDITKNTVTSNKFDIMNQHPNEEVPKFIDLNLVISENNDQINFDFKKIKDKQMTNRILREKDINVQKINDLKKDYEHILKKNTTLNSNYKFIKVYHTNTSPEKVSLNSTKRQRQVSFVESCDDLPHNTTLVKPILQKPGRVRRIKIVKTKQTVFIKKLR